MSEEVVRRVRLPADRRTPAVARAFVRSVLNATQFTDLLDEALLLTTELSTNGVLHAGTDLDLEVVVDLNGLTITVLDLAPGLLDFRPTATSADGTHHERGRGLLLVDHFASRWGTTHFNKGKGVWFRLDRPGAAVGSPVPEAASRVDMAATTSRVDAAGLDVAAGLGVGGSRGADSGADALTALLAITPDPLAGASDGQFAEELLHRLAERVGASGAVIRLDRGGDPIVLAQYGVRVPPSDASVLRVPLPVSRPWSGTLELVAPAAAGVQPLAMLVAERLGLALENERLRLTDLRRQTWLTFLAEASELLAQSLDVELTLALVPQLLVPRLGRWCAVHVTDQWGMLAFAAAAHTDETELPALQMLLQDSAPGGLLERLTEAANGSGSMPLTPPVEGFAVPLMARGQRLGVLSVGRHADHRQDPDEVAVVEDVARRGALALDNARIHQERRRLAHTLQQSLLPPELPAIAGVGLGAEYVPAGDEVEVGGDFYDVVGMPDGRWLLVIGDVSGKGVQAATVTGRVRDVIRVLVGEGRSLPSVLSTLNSTLLDRGDGRYCTLALAAVTCGLDGILDVRLHLAGHDRPVLLSSHSDRPSFVGSSGTALGLLDSVTSPAVDHRLVAGDTLIFYTDGVTERRRRRELFGRDRLLAAAEPLIGYPANVVAARLRAVTLGFSPEPPRDDIAILVLRNDATD